jgi:K+-transporting ATPase ATPase A chain
MTPNGVFQIAVFFLVLLAITKPLGSYMAKVFAGERTFMHRVLRPLERLCYAACGVDEAVEQRWTQYAGSLLAFSIFSFLILYLLQRLQGWLPLNPMGFGTAHAPSGATAITPDLAFNTAVSFTTNTNWQSYSGESTLSYLVQMAGLTMHNFTSAAVGISVAVALIRAFARRQMQSIGNFWADLVRATVYLLLPIAIVVAVFFCSQGVIQNFHPYTTATTLEGKTQTIAQGPVASQEVIKMLGTNGGGFFNANSAHPFENPTPLTNMTQVWLIFMIPAGLAYTFGKVVGDTRQGWALFAAMSVLFLVGAFVVYGAEQSGNPILAKLGLQTASTAGQAGGNMEGKETRFGIAASSLFATVTTDASCGAVNGMHDSLTPMGGLITLFNMEVGEVIFGGAARVKEFETLLQRI